MKPGLVGPNQILGRNEEECYPQGVDPDRFYLEEILPKKLPLDLQYVQEKSFFRDVKYLLWGAWATIAGAIKRQHFTDNLSQILMFTTDCVCCLVAFMLAYWIRFDTVLPLVTDPVLTKILPLTIAARLPLLMYLGCYQNLIRYLSIQNLKQVFLGRDCRQWNFDYTFEFPWDPFSGVWQGGIYHRLVMPYGIADRLPDSPQDFLSAPQ